MVSKGWNPEAEDEAEGCSERPESLIRSWSQGIPGSETTIFLTHDENEMI